MEIEKLRSKDYDGLSTEDIDLLKANGIMNGYGPASNWLARYVLKRIAPLLSTASADCHDFNYWKGGTEDDRRNADFGFYERMVADIAKNKDKQTAYYATLSYVFFISVRAFGRYHFNYE